MLLGALKRFRLCTASRVSPPSTDTHAHTHTRSLWSYARRRRVDAGSNKAAAPTSARLRAATVPD